MAPADGPSAWWSGSRQSLGIPWRRNGHRQANADRRRTGHRLSEGSEEISLHAKACVRARESREPEAGIQFSRRGPGLRMGGPVRAPNASSGALTGCRRRAGLRVGLAQCVARILGALVARRERSSSLASSATYSPAEA
jgi:hypothetical protein